MCYPTGFYIYISKLPANCTKIKEINATGEFGETSIRGRGVRKNTERMTKEEMDR